MNFDFKFMEGKVLDNFSNYIIRENGTIYSKRTNKVMSATKVHNGYCVVTLTSDDNVKKRYYIHRLIAKAFIPNPNNLPEVNHKNEDKSDNSVSNLEWCDRKYNMNYNNLPLRSNASSKKHITFINIYNKETISFDSHKDAAIHFGVRDMQITRAILYNRLINKTYKYYGA